MDQFTFSILDADGKESANDATYDITILSGYTPSFIVCRVELSVWFCGVTVSTPDSESGNPSSNLGRIYFAFW